MAIGQMRGGVPGLLRLPNTIPARDPQKFISDKGKHRTRSHSYPRFSSVATGQIRKAQTFLDYYGFNTDSGTRPPKFISRRESGSFGTSVYRRVKIQAPIPVGGAWWQFRANSGTDVTIELG
jgi:hypothetical protein